MKYSKQLILERLSKNYAYDDFCFENIEFSYNPFRDCNNRIYIKKNGIILDIHLKKLYKLLKKIDYICRNDNKKIAIQENIENTAKVDIEQDKLEKKYSVVIYKALYDDVSVNNPKILGIDDNIPNIDQKFINNLNKRVEKCFEIKDKKSSQEKLDSEIKDIDSNFSTAIIGKNRLNIKRYSDIYINIIKTFTDSLSPFGKYNSKDAMAERTSLGRGWTNLQYINDSFDHLIHEAILTKDKNIAYELISLVHTTVTSSMSDGDHLVFQKFFPLFKSFYFEVKNNEKNEFKDFILDEIVFFILGISNLFYPILIDKEKYYNYSVDNVDFAYPVLKSYQSLLKNSIDNLDKDFFSKLLDEYNNLFYYLKNKSIDITFQELERFPYLNEPDDIARVYSKINLSKHMILFALATYILHQYLASNDEKKVEYKNFLMEFFKYLTSDLDKVLFIYNKTNNHENEMFWGWGYWLYEMKTVPEVQEINFGYKLSLMIVIFILFKVQNINLADSKIEKLTNNFFHDNINENGDLKKALKEIEENINLKELIDFDSQKKSDLTELLDKIDKKYKIIEKERIINSELSVEKVDEYQNKIIAAYRAKSSLRNLYEISEKYKVIPEEDKIFRKGYNLLLSKELFIDSSHSIKDMTSNQWAEGLIYHEDKQIFIELLSKCKKKSTNLTSLDVHFYQDLNKDSIILCSLEKPTKFDTIFNSSSDFIESWQIDKKDAYANILSFTGYLKHKHLKIPVFNFGWINNTDIKERVAVIDLKKIGKFIHFAFSEKKNDTFFFKITDLNEFADKRKEIIEANPEWLKN